MFNELLQQGKIYVGETCIHNTSTAKNEYIHVKWSEDTGLIVLPEDIESVVIKLKDSKKDKKGEGFL